MAETLCDVQFVERLLKIIDFVQLFQESNENQMPQFQTLRSCPFTAAASDGSPLFSFHLKSQLYSNIF
jgi:hypothetical protein